MTTPSPDQIKTLEQSRQRLVQLTHSLGSLITSLNQSDPLPSWCVLSNQASRIAPFISPASLSPTYKLTKLITTHMKQALPPIPSKHHLLKSSNPIDATLREPRTAAKYIRVPVA